MPGFYIWMSFLVQDHEARHHATSLLSGNRSPVLLWADLADVHQSQSTYAVIMKCNWHLQVSVSDDLITRTLLRTWIFRRVRKIVKSDHLLRCVCPCVCPSVPPHGTTRSHWTDCGEIIRLSIFWKSVEKIQVLLKSDKSNWYYIQFYLSSLSFS